MKIVSSLVVIYSCPDLTNIKNVNLYQGFLFNPNRTGIKYFLIGFDFFIGSKFSFFLEL